MELISKDVPDFIRDAYGEGTIANVTPLPITQFTNGSSYVSPLILASVAYSPTLDKFVVAGRPNDPLYPSGPSETIEASTYMDPPLYPTFYTTSGPNYDIWEPCFLPKVWEDINGNKPPVSNRVINRFYVEKVIWSDLNQKFYAVGSIAHNHVSVSGSSGSFTIATVASSSIHVVESTDGINWDITYIFPTNSFQNVYNISSPGDALRYRSISANSLYLYTSGASITTRAYRYSATSKQHPTEISTGIHYTTWIEAFNLFIGSQATALFSSPDGSTWTSRSTVSNRVFFAWSPSLNLLIASASSGSNRYSTSTTGTSWTTRTSLDSYNVIRGIVWSEYHSAFIAVNHANGSSTVEILQSTDGLAWSVAYSFSKGSTTLNIVDIDISSSGLLLLTLSSTSNSGIMYVNSAFTSAYFPDSTYTPYSRFSSIAFDESKNMFFATAHSYNGTPPTSLIWFKSPKTFYEGIETYVDTRYFNLEYIPALRKTIAFGYDVGFISGNGPYTIQNANFNSPYDFEPGDCMVGVAWDSKRQRLLACVTKKASSPLFNFEDYTTLLTSSDGERWEALPTPTLLYNGNTWASNPYVSRYLNGFGLRISPSLYTGSETHPATSRFTLSYNEETDTFVYTTIPILPVIYNGVPEDTFRPSTTLIKNGGEVIDFREWTNTTPSYIIWSPENRMYLGSKLIKPSGGLSGGNDIYPGIGPLETWFAEDYHRYGSPFVWSKDGVTWEDINFSSYLYDSVESFENPLLVKWIEPLKRFVAIGANEYKFEYKIYTSTNGFDWKEYPLLKYIPFSNSFAIKDFVWSESQEMIVFVGVSSDRVPIMYTKPPRLIVSDTSPSTVTDFGPGDIWIQTVNDKPFYAD